jgi:hypothetical protein
MMTPNEPTRYKTTYDCFRNLIIIDPAAYIPRARVISIRTGGSGTAAASVVPVVPVVSVVDRVRVAVAGAGVTSE